MPPQPNDRIESSSRPSRPLEEQPKRQMNTTLENGIAMPFRQEPPETSRSTTTIQPNGLHGVLDTSNFNSEYERLRTFEGWPVTFISASAMAAAGFYYLKVADTVRCAFCGVEVGCWVEGDDPMQDHQRWSPSCRFVRKLPSGNIPLTNTSNSHSSDHPRENGYEPYVCGHYGIEFRPFAGSDNGTNGTDRSTPSLEKLGVHKSRAPSFPNYASLEARLRSYEMWPIALKLKPNMLSDAGFFYTGKGDQTICFHCGGGLKDWEESDEPWVEHARWFSKCSYVLMVKGKDFVDEVCGRKNNEEEKEKTEDGDIVGDAKSTTNVTLRSSTPSSSKECVNKTSEAKPIASSSSSSDSSLLSTSLAASSSPADSRLCKICYTDEMGVVFLPCGHLVACVKCALSLTTCAVCRQPVTATVRAFLS